MKARVIKTGVVVEVQECNTTLKDRGYDYISIHNGYVYRAEDLYIDVDPDYWTRLKHQYAGMAMQGIVSNSKVELDYEGDEGCFQAVAAVAYRFAHALVEKMKEERK